MVGLIYSLWEVVFIPILSTGIVGIVWKKIN